MEHLRVRSDCLLYECIILHIHCLWLITGQLSEKQKRKLCCSCGMHLQLLCDFANSLLRFQAIISALFFRFVGSDFSPTASCFHGLGSSIEVWILPWMTSSQCSLVCTTKTFSLQWRCAFFIGLNKYYELWYLTTKTPPCVSPIAALSDYSEQMNNADHKHENFVKMNFSASLTAKLASFQYAYFGIKDLWHCQLKSMLMVKIPRDCSTTNEALPL